MIPVNLNETTGECDASRKKSILQLKPFIWDRVIFLLASTIFGLSVSGIFVDFLKPEKYTLACFSPFENRAQYTYVNSYCYKYIPVEEYFSIVLILHAAALVDPHYLWKFYFSAKVDCFCRHVSKLETLRDRNTGKYPCKNYYIVQYLQRQFANKKAILISYIVKLFLQLFLILISVAVNWCIFGGIDSNITFECYDDNEISHLFGNITCAYPQKISINVLRVADFCLLVVAILMITIGLFWSFLYNHSLQDKKVANFCYDSGVDPKYYYHSISKKRLCWCQMKDDFRFLLATLLATDSGFRQVFKDILTEDIIFKKFTTKLAANKGTHILCFTLISQLLIIITYKL